VTPILRPAQGSAGHGQRGFALVMVLWVLVLLTLLGTGFGRAVRVESRAGIAADERLRLEAAALAGVARGIHGLLITDPERAWRLDGRSYEIPWTDASLRVTMRSENGKIDINFAPAPLLAGLFEALLPDADADALADAVLDWRDGDDRRRPKGAEAADYAAAGRSYGPANRPFRSPWTLSQVLGLNGAAVERLLPYVTIHARRPRVDPFSADARVLAAIPGIEPEAAEAFVAQRRRTTEGGPVDLQPLSGGSRYLDRRPSTGLASIRVEARAPSGGRLIREAVVRLKGRSQGYEILSWRQIPAGSER